MRSFYIGTAGWTIPRNSAHQFAGAGSHLERYSRVFTAVEINSSFHRPHKLSTYERWAASVPTGFRFAVKAPREITHVARLKNVGEALKGFLKEACGLGDKLGPILFQLPPSRAFDAGLASGFCELLRELHDGPSVLEPRHPSWFEPGPENLLRRFRIARVAADPARAPRAAEPGGWASLVYFRLHGTPRMYYSAYGSKFLQELSARLAALAGRGTVWCIFDNTAAGAATSDARTLLESITAAVGHTIEGGTALSGGSPLP